MNSLTQPSNNRILVIDDNQAIHDDFRKILVSQRSKTMVLTQVEAAFFGESSPAGFETSFEVDSAFQGEEGLAMVKRALAADRPYAMAFVDVRMPPGWDGIETIKRIWEVDPELQVVICTAYSDYSWEQMTAQVSQPDSLVILKKPFDNIEVLQLAHALTKKWLLNSQANAKLGDLERMVNFRTEELLQEIAERGRTQAALRVSEERFSKAFHNSPIPKAIQTLKEQRYVDVNDAFLQMTGFVREEVIDRTPADLQLWQPELGAKIPQRLQQDKSIQNLECQVRTKSGERRTILMSVELFNQGVEPYMLVVAQDISEHLHLESQLRQAQVPTAFVSGKFPWCNM